MEMSPLEILNVALSIVIKLLIIGCFVIVPIWLENEKYQEVSEVKTCPVDFILPELIVHR